MKGGRVFVMTTLLVLLFGCLAACIQGKSHKAFLFPRTKDCLCLHAKNVSMRGFVLKPSNRFFFCGGNSKKIYLRACVDEPVVCFHVFDTTLIVKLKMYQK